MTRWVYSLLMWLAQPLLRRKLRRRGVQEVGYLLAVDERFGRYTAEVPAHAGATVWIHAVSLGETRAAAVLITALRARLPGMRLLLTHGTATGRAEGQRLLQPGDLQTWQPWDTPGAVRRFLHHFQPRIGVLMETEIWPNLVAACQQGGVPLVLANARMSAKSLRQAQRLAWLARPAFAGLSAVWAQTPLDAERLAQLDAPVQGVLGNIKFDAKPDAAQVALGRQWRSLVDRPVVMFASSREGEELALLLALKGVGAVSPVGQTDSAIDSEVNTVQWMIVPRHPQRFDQVAGLIQAHGFTVSRRSHWGQSGPLPTQTQMATAPDNSDVSAVPSIWLGDSLGEMALYYGLGDVALLGGSFEPLGGQNLIEAAACACPVVMGPHTFNFSQAAEQAQAAGAAQRAPDLPTAMSMAAELASDSVALSAAGQAAAAFAQVHRGAAVRLAQHIVVLLNREHPSGTVQG